MPRRVVSNVVYSTLSYVHCVSVRERAWPLTRLHSPDLALANTEKELFFVTTDHFPRIYGDIFKIFKTISIFANVSLFLETQTEFGRLRFFFV